MIAATVTLALALGAMSAVSDFAVTPEVAAKDAAQCGLGPVTMTFSDELQSEILTPSDAASASEAQLACLDRATRGQFVILPPDVQPRFDAIRSARASALAVRDARAWLAARGLLERVPKFVQGDDRDGAFAGQIESICGSKARGTLVSREGFFFWKSDLTSNPGVSWTSIDPEVFACLRNALTAAGASFGFTGNEAFRGHEPIR